MASQVGTDPAQQAVTGRRTITRLDFGTGKFGGCYFSLWKAEQDGVIAVSPSSPEQARARLAAKLEAR